MGGNMGCFNMILIFIVNLVNLVEKKKNELVQFENQSRVEQLLEVIEVIMVY